MMFITAGCLLVPEQHRTSTVCLSAQVHPDSENEHTFGHRWVRRTSEQWNGIFVPDDQSVTMLDLILRGPLQVYSVPSWTYWSQWKSASR